MSTRAALPACTASASAAALALVVQPVGIRDWPLLDMAVTRLLDGGLEAAYSMPGFLQGPLALVVGLAFHPLPHAEQVWAVVAGAALGPLLWWFCRPLPWSLALLPVLPWASFAAAGHPDDLGAVVLMLVACRKGSGLIVAAAAAFKPWAVAGVAALRSLPAWAAFVVGTALLWLPVVLAHPSTEIQHNPIQSASPMGYVFDGVMPAWVRPAQLLLIAVVALIAARRVTLERAMLAALAVRVMTEPGDFDYYFGPLALLGAVTGSRRTTVLVVLAWLAKVSPWPAATRLVLLVALLAVVVRPTEDTQPERAEVQQPVLVG